MNTLNLNTYLCIYKNEQDIEYGAIDHETAVLFAKAYGLQELGCTSIPTLSLTGHFVLNTQASWITRDRQEQNKLERLASGNAILYLGNIRIVRFHRLG